MCVMDPRLQENHLFFSARPSQRHLKGKKKHVSDTSFFEWHHALSGAGMLQAFKKNKELRSRIAQGVMALYGTHGKQGKRRVYWAAPALG